MRRRGLGALELKKRTDFKIQREIFKTNLQEFARKYRKDIRKDPQFRMHFQKMCSNINVDPLASNKGFWAELLGVGNFYYELGIQIIDVCLSTRVGNGGLLELGELKRRLEKMRNASGSSTSIQEISEDDIMRSIKTLKPLGNGFEILQIGSRKMVISVPRELNVDQSSLLTLAQERGYITKEIVASSLSGWSTERINNAIDNLLADGLCWIDTQANPHEYWVYSFFDGMDDENVE
ncbi:12818_t:CDS:2 [Ambispora gerdemannii]|uniref:12818_t:CDS:1 n=1 Tax=Ambispora gerdemannii TaxID=144530 RepID=A0A9N8Z506_9GLOM|nr:12818_t:CDS:2 [Ambispora gerdemannii]